MAGALRVLLHNWHLKLAALGLAILLWALVQTEPLSQETFAAVPVAVDVFDSSWTIARSPSPATVELRLGGPAREIIRLARDGTTLRIPVAYVGSRDTIIALQREWVNLGERAGVTVESVSPLTVSMAFEPAVARNVDLRDADVQLSVVPRELELRPLLHLLSARLCGFREHDAEYLLGSVVEYIHTASLLHDDVIDGRFHSNTAFAISRVDKKIPVFNDRVTVAATRDFTTADDEIARRQRGDSMRPWGKAMKVQPARAMAERVSTDNAIAGFFTMVLLCSS